MNFEVRLQNLRLAKKLSLSQMAKRASVPVSSYQEWEQGRKIRNIEVYIKLAKALDVSLSELILGKPEQVNMSLAADKLTQACQLLQECKSIILALG